MRPAAIFLAFILLSSAATVAVFSSGAQIRERVYTWDFLGESYRLVLSVSDGASSNRVGLENGTWTIRMSIPYSAYSFYKELPGGFRYSFNHSYLQYFLTSNDTYIQELAGDLGYIAASEGFDSLTTLNFVLSFVQNAIVYLDDLQTTGFYDYYKFPLETLIDGGGDCEDKSILMATISHILGYDVILIVMNITLGSSVGHVAVGANLSNVNRSNPLSTYLKYYYLYDGKRYYYMETTASDTHGIVSGHYYVGVSPEEYGYTISNVTLVPYRDSWYSGYSGNYPDAGELHAEQSFPWFAVIIAILLAIYIPLFSLSILRERPRCPNCGFEIDGEWDYCPNCGYWLGYDNSRRRR